jgi:hypothetical protein
MNNLFDFQMDAITAQAERIRRETPQQKAQRTFRERLDEEYVNKYRECRANGDKMGASFWFAMWFN